MKLFYLLTILFFLIGCSFDNKSGIWKNESQLSSKNKDLFKEFKSVSNTEETFYKIVSLDKNFKFKKSNLEKNLNWSDIYHSKDNNFKNFQYNNQNQLIFKSKKITKNNTNKYILFDRNNIITSDEKGNVIVFSVNQNKEIAKFNFYKKQYKKISKVLNLAIENSVIYISDNLGYLYAFNYNINKLLWAKNYKIPFRSNIKITKNKIILANQNNSLFFIDKKNGEILRSVPTEESIIKNNFINNLAVFKNNVIFLNTYGSLYSINIKSMRINWFINLNQSLNADRSRSFTSSQLIISSNRIFVPTNNNFYILNFTTGEINYKKNFTSFLKPLVVGDILYTVSNNLLIATAYETGKIIFSYDINQKIAEYLSTKKRKVELKSLMFLENKIFIFLKNSFVLKFSNKGDLLEISKLPEKINSEPIIIDDTLVFLNKKNKIAVIN